MNLQKQTGELIEIEDGQVIRYSDLLSSHLAAPICLVHLSGMRRSRTQIFVMQITFKIAEFTGARGLDTCMFDNDDIRESILQAARPRSPQR